MKRLILAIQFLTRLPMPSVAAGADDFAASMRWFPAVGLIIGSLVAAAAWAGALIDPWIGALAALAAWTGVTGALHLDGLGDIADASGAAHKDKAQLAAVLHDPHVGSFGAVAITLQLIAKLVLLHALVESDAYVALTLIAFAARMGPLVWTVCLPSLHDGLGARFRQAVRPRDLILWAGLLAAAALLLSPSLSGSPVIIFLWALWLRRRIGGISGDGHGAGIEISETWLLLAAVIWSRMT
ncbi:cobalamin synthase [Sphingobium sp. C100]|uniref:adenosylcobinamide-GDP ribazoletransferase n=1 Tax=Sphingobium sp. C100 TaxID=1207055 RepID=UPI0003D6340C|nr:adenosylcobinamide-GDP ribazoletransferase [Sphingobium sp. C100]ETI58564.1 cobalamin synthase [Sphingobium sp. C100]